MRPTWRGVGLLVTVLGALGVSLGGCGGDGSARVVELEGPSMGTRYRVVAVTTPDGPDAEALRPEIESILERLEELMSTWRPDSELSRFNDSASLEWTPLALETWTVMRHALDVHRLTRGAFDPTVGPLVELWGFGATGTRARSPLPSELSAVRARVGASRLELREQPRGARKTESHLRVDLSGVAKGFAVDAVAARLERLGVARYLVEIGGELRGGGEGPEGPWRVGIERPDAPGAQIHCRVRLRDAALATSGDYQSYWEHEGQRYSHVVDPRSGRPVAHGLASVSVLAPSAVRADALATGLMVLGPDEGMRLARREGLAVLALIRGADGLAERSTPEFDAHRMP